MQAPWHQDNLKIEGNPQESLVQTIDPQPEWKKKGVVYQCRDQAVQGGLASSNSQACGDQPLKKETIKALHIHLQQETSYLDYKRTLSPVWHPLL